MALSLTCTSCLLCLFSHAVLRPCEPVDTKIVFDIVMFSSPKMYGICNTFPLYCPWIILVHFSAPLLNIQVWHQLYQPFEYAEVFRKCNVHKLDGTEGSVLLLGTPCAHCRCYILEQHASTTVLVVVGINGQACVGIGRMIDISIYAELQCLIACSFQVTQHSSCPNHLMLLGPFQKGALHTCSHCYVWACVHGWIQDTPYYASFSTKLC